jgi:hypothetical protein
MDFASSYDLINGPFIRSRKAFDDAVDNTTVDENVKDWAKTFEARVWGDTHPRMTVEQTGNDTLEFTVTGVKLIAEVTIGPAPQPTPDDLTTSQIKLLHEIDSIASNYVGGGAYFVESLAYGDHLRLGAVASGTLENVTTNIYSKELLTSLVVVPHVHSA